MQHLYEIFTINLQALYEYRPEAYDGPTTLLRAGKAGPGKPPRDKSNGWDRVARGGVQVRLVPGTHYTMLREPQVDRLARELERALR